VTCPDRLALFIGLEEDDAAVRAHVHECAACRAVAEGEQDLTVALSRVRDPAPPPELLSGAMRRVEEAAELSLRSRRQTAGILSGLGLVLAVCFGFAGPSTAVSHALNLAGTLSAARTALAAVVHGLGPTLAGLAVPLVATQVLALLCVALVFHRFVAVRVRN
jgi:predicted anti-sigma-YlaC factor YlaD